MNAGKQRSRRLQPHVGLEGIVARLADRQQLALPLAFTRGADAGIFLGDLDDIIVALRVAHQRGRDTDCAARVEDMNHRSLVRRVDAQRGVDAAGGRAADQERHRHLRALHFLGRREPTGGIVRKRGVRDLGDLGLHASQRIRR